MRTGDRPAGQRAFPAPPRGQAESRQRVAPGGRTRRARLPSAGEDSAPPGNGTGRGAPVAPRPAAPTGAPRQAGSIRYTRPPVASTYSSPAASSPKESTLPTSPTGHSRRSSACPPCVAEAADPPLAVVGVEVVPAERRDAAAAVHVAAGDGAPLRVAVFQHRHHQPRPAAPLGGAEAPAPLHHAPPVVEPAARGGDHVDLLQRALPHVGKVQQPGLAVEGEAPRVPHAARPDLVAGGALPRVGVVRGDGVRVAGVHVDAQDVAQQRRAVLPVPLRVAAPAAVAHPHVQLAVRPERHQPAVVVGERLRHPEDQLGRRRVRAVAVGAHPVALDARVAARRCSRRRRSRWRRTRGGRRR